MDAPRRISKYELQEFLGGAMSHVYKARDTVLGRIVAIKILTDQGIADSETKNRFLEEARLSASLSHENIIRFYDYGEENGRPYIVMELLTGETLGDAIRARRYKTVCAKLAVALELGRALEYIHSRHIIHRDVKPQNIHIDESRRVKLMDFGVAKQEGLALTAAGFTLGTPYYMAPEQVQGRSLTHRIDIYAFGVVLLEFLTGSRAINGSTVERIFDEIVYTPLDLAPLRAMQMPDAVCTLIERCTAKNPDERFARFAEVCRELERILNENCPDGDEPLRGSRSGIFGFFRRGPSR
jgi:serine/threonine-protein kinase